MAFGVFLHFLVHETAKPKHRKTNDWEQQKHKLFSHAMMIHHISGIEEEHKGQGQPEVWSVFTNLLNHLICFRQV